MPKNLKYDGVGFNMEWVSSFKTEKQFLSATEVKHLFPEKELESRIAALQEVYSLCRLDIKPISPVTNEPKSEE